MEKDLTMVCNSVFTQSCFSNKKTDRQRKIKISTINLCLGLKNKKLLVKRLMDDNKIDVLCMQETEVGNDLNIDQLSISGYSLELEKNSIKSRVGVYISKSVKYVRLNDIFLTEKKAHMCAVLFQLYFINS